jgi:hypothetical protein
MLSGKSGERNMPAARGSKTRDPTSDPTRMAPDSNNAQLKSRATPPHLARHAGTKATADRALQNAEASRTPLAWHSGASDNLLFEDHRKHFGGLSLSGGDLGSLGTRTEPAARFARFVGFGTNELFVVPHHELSPALA